MFKLNIFGSTGIIGSKSLDIINNYCPEIKLNLILAKSDFKKIAKQAKIYKPTYVCLTDESKYKQLKNELNNTKIKIIMNNEIHDFLKKTKSNMSILGISGYSSLNYIEQIIMNTSVLGIVSKECIVAGGKLINEYCIKYKTELFPLDSEHYSIHNFFYQRINFNSKMIKNVFLTASGGPFLKNNIQKIKKTTSFKNALQHPKWKMGIKNSIDSATLVNKCLEIIEAHYLFDIQYEKLKILIHPESLVHSIIEYCNYTSFFNYFYHDMFIPLYNFLKKNSINNENINLNKKYDINMNMKLNFFKPSYSNFPILKIFHNLDKSKPENIIKFNSGNELAVELFSKGKIKFNDITKIIEKSISIELNLKINDIKNIIIYQNEFINKLNEKLNVR